MCISKSFKYIIISLLLFISFFAGFFFNKLKQQKANLRKDSSEFHALCKSQMEGKIYGRPCSTCMVKWRAQISNIESDQDKIIKYAEIRFGKPVEQFTNSETLETFYMMFE